MIDTTTTTPTPERILDTEAAPLVVLSDAAAEKLRELTAAEADPNVGLRVYVYSGGCSGSATG